MTIKVKTCIFLTLWDTKILSIMHTKIQKQLNTHSRILQCNCRRVGATHKMWGWVLSLMGSQSSLCSPTHHSKPLSWSVHANLTVESMVTGESPSDIPCSWHLTQWINPAWVHLHGTYEPCSLTSCSSLQPLLSLFCAGSCTSPGLRPEHRVLKDSSLTSVPFLPSLPGSV